MKPYHCPNCGIEISLGSALRARRTKPLTKAHARKMGIESAKRRAAKRATRSVTEDRLRFAKTQNSTTTLFL